MKHRDFGMNEINQLQETALYLISFIRNAQTPQINKNKVVVSGNYRERIDYQ